MRVLILSDFFAPGFRAGGPIRSLVGIVEQLGSEIAFSVLTAATDLGVTSSLPGIKADEWNEQVGAQVYYTSGRRLSPLFLRRIVKHSAPDVIYLNSFFSARTVATLFFRRIGVLPRVPTLVAPRGEFSRGALGLKSNKKQAYLALARRLGMFSGLAWHVTSQEEATDLQRTLPGARNIHIAPNLLSSSSDGMRTIEKESGRVRLAFISRISPKKNLLSAIHFLQSVTGDVVFHVYGPLEDREYWAECLAASSQLPGNIDFSYCGELPHQEVAETFAQYHFMILPTLGENFGHSIAESLQQGVPVLISDQTPWRNLEESGVGWDVSLNELQEWARVLDICVGMDNGTYHEMSHQCRGFAEKWVFDQGGRNANLEMFRSVSGMR